MDYDDLYIKNIKTAMEQAILNGAAGDGTGNYIKNLLSPTIVACTYCGKTLTGTDYEKSLHTNECINRKMSEELASTRARQEVRENLLKELKKLL